MISRFVVCSEAHRQELVPNDVLNTKPGENTINNVCLSNIREKTF